MSGNKRSRALIKNRTVLFVVTAVFAGLMFVPPAAAHDPDCTATVHAGPAKAHYDCKDDDDDPSPGGCVVSVKFQMVRISAGC